MRRASLPPALFEVFAGVDLILHAGDVGELWVLNQLGAIAPVVAVHGNDDTDEAQRELPYRQLVAVAGVRILLWHSHYPDRHEEVASRRDDALLPKFERLLLFGRRAEAQVVVFGHWHIPLVYTVDGLTLVNPGALAADSLFTATRQDTVALLYIDDTAHTHIVHVDLARPHEAFRPVLDLHAGFAAGTQRYSRPIITADMAAALPFLRRQLRRDETAALIPMLTDLARPLWEGTPGQISLEAVTAELRRTRKVAPALTERVLDLIDEWRATHADV